jgi:hypothetical protein
VSKERARRREAREREAAQNAARKAAALEAATRRRDRRRSLFAPVLEPVRRTRLALSTGKQRGPLAERRRTRTRLIVMVLLFAQVVVWIVRPDWQARLAAAVLALFAVPVITAFTL